MELGTNIIEDKWFNLREFYATDKGQATFVLDERTPEDKDEDPYEGEWHKVGDEEED